MGMGQASANSFNDFFNNLDPQSKQLVGMLGGGQAMQLLQLISSLGGDLQQSGAQLASTTLDQTDIGTSQVSIGNVASQQTAEIAQEIKAESFASYSGPSLPA